MFVICTSRYLKAGTTTGDDQQPANLKANPAYCSVKNSQQFTMSTDAVYSTIDEGNYQNILRRNPADFSLKKSVASLDNCGQKNIFAFRAYLGNTLTR